MTDRSWRNKKVENFNQQEYQEFWEQHLSTEVRYFCDICNKPIQKRNLISHMEKNHDQKYRQHKRSLFSEQAEQNE